MTNGICGDGWHPSGVPDFYGNPDPGVFDTPATFWHASGVQLICQCLTARMFDGANA